MKLTEEQQNLLKIVVEHFDGEDRSVRERQIRQWRRLKLLWDGFTRIWYDEVAHDWRIWDEQKEDDNQQDYYNKPVNVFRAYLESIIAALSIVVPPIKCYPDDADNPLDIQTAKAGDKIAELVSRHNDVSLLWLHALFVFCTEGMVACYNYTNEDEKYGTYKENEYKDFKEENDVLVEDEFDPNGEPVYRKETVTVTRLVGIIDKPKARQCMEVYGGLYVKVANYAKKQKDTPYLQFSYETNYVFARDRYPDLRDKIGPESSREPYERWGRTNPQYYGEEPLNNVTCRNVWLRPCAFEVLDKVEESKELKKLFPAGAKVVMINQEFAEAKNESLDDHWTLTNNPLSDHIHFEPIGLLMTSVQEITNDLISLIIQTIEHGIGQTFFDPRFLNAEAYRQMETVPGGMYATNPIVGGKSIKDGFFEIKTASLSGEVLPFLQKIQEFGQLVTGALPSLFGGLQQGGSNTASEYSMSRAQALQRLQNTWKIFTVWWKTIYGKVIPAYIKTVTEDQKIVQKDEFGNFINILIRKSELEGKIGNIELEANENLPMTWTQRRDVIMKLMEANNPQILAMIAQPENLALIYEAIGITDFYVPGEDDRNKQYDEIKQLLNSEPILVPPTPEEELMSIEQEMPAQEHEEPSVEVDPVMDNHEIEFEIVRKWAISEAGRLAKTENEAGYRNVLLHGIMHKQLIMPMIPEGEGAAPLANPKQNKQAPITEDSNVS